MKHLDKIYYTVYRCVDDSGTLNGIEYVTAYKILNNEIKTLSWSEIENNDNQANDIYISIIKERLKNKYNTTKTVFIEL